MYQCCKCQAKFNKLHLLTQHIVEKCVVKTPSPMKKPKEEEEEEGKSFKANLKTLSSHEQVVGRTITKERQDDESLQLKKENDKEQDFKSLINVNSYDHSKSDLKETRTLLEICKNTDNICSEQNKVAKKEPALGNRKTLSLDLEKELVYCTRTLQFADGSYAETNANFQHIDAGQSGTNSPQINMERKTVDTKVEGDDNEKKCIEGEKLVEARTENNTSIEHHQPTGIIKVGEDHDDEKKSVRSNEEIAEGRSKDSTSIDEVAHPSGIINFRDDDEKKCIISNEIHVESTDELAHASDILKVRRNYDEKTCIASNEIAGEGSRDGPSIDDVAHPSDIIKVKGNDHEMMRIISNEKGSKDSTGIDNVAHPSDFMKVKGDDHEMMRIISNERGSKDSTGIDDVAHPSDFMKKCIIDNEIGEKTVEEVSRDNPSIDNVAHASDIIKAEANDHEKKCTREGIADECTEDNTTIVDGAQPTDIIIDDEKDVAKECTKNNTSVDDVAQPTDVIKIEGDDDEVKCMEDDETREQIVKEQTKSKADTQLKQIVLNEENPSDIIPATINTNTVSDADIANDTLVCKSIANKMVSSEEDITEVRTVVTLKACIFCNESFSYNFQLKRHKLKNCRLFLAHRKKYSPSLASKNICKNCSLKFANASALKTHMLVYCKLYKYQNTSIHTITRNKRKKGQIRRIKKEATPREAEMAHSSSKSVPQQQAVVQSTQPKQNDDTSKKNKPKADCDQNESLANYCAKHCICDICFSHFFNFAALATHKKYYCKRFGGSSSLNKSPGKDEDNLKLIKHEADNSGKIKIKSSTSLSTGTGKDDGKEGTKKKSCSAKETLDSLTTATNSSNAKQALSDEPSENISCEQCGNVFRYICELVSHRDRVCTKMKSENEQTASQNGDEQNVEAKHTVQTKELQTKKKKKKLLICPYCNNEFSTELDLSTHKMLYCKEMNKKKKLLALTLDQKDNRVAKTISKDVPENAKDKDSSTSAPEVPSGKKNQKTVEAQDGSQTQQILCYLCGSEFYYQSALELHQSKYCKIFNIPKAKNKNQSEVSKSASEPNKGNAPKNFKDKCVVDKQNIPSRDDTLKSADLKTSITSDQEKDEKADVFVNDQTTANDVKRPKSPVTAPAKDPDEDKNICNICGSHFEYSFALQKHKTLYCKSFLSPKSGNADKVSEVTKCVDKILLISKDISKECSGDSSKSTETKDLNKIMYNDGEANILMEKEQATKEKAMNQEAKPKKSVETGDFKCETCNATFKYEVDLGWHKYKSKYKSCAESTGALADDVRGNHNNNAKSIEKSRDAKACKTYPINPVSNSIDKNISLIADADKQPKAEDELDKSKKSVRSDEDYRRRGFDLRDTLKRKSQCGPETKRRRSRSFESDLPSTSRSHETKFSKEKRSGVPTGFQHRKQIKSDHVPYDSKRYEANSRERSTEKTEVSSSREYESKHSMPKRKRPTYEIMEADSSSDKRKKAPERTNTRVIVKKSSARKKVSDSDDSSEELATTPSPSVTRVYNKVSSYKHVRPLKSSIFCEQCGTSLNNAAEVRKPPCGHHRTSFPCAVCKYSFPNINTLIRHQEEEHQTDEVILKEMEKADKHSMVKYFCCLCGVDFNFIKNLIYHKVSEHKFFHRMFTKDGTAPIIRPVNPNLEGFACVFCDQMLFSSLKELFDHEDKSKRHKKNEKKFKKIKSNYNPIEHQRFVHICYVCNLGFISFKEQQIHMLESPEHYQLEKKNSELSKQDLLRLDKTLTKYSALKSKYLHEEAKAKKSASFPSSSRPLPFETERDKFARKQFSDNIQANDLYRKVANILNCDADSVVSSSKTESGALPTRSYSQNFEPTRNQSPESMIPIIDLSSASNYAEAYPGTSGSNSSFTPHGFSREPVRMQKPYSERYQINNDTDRIDLTDDRFGRFKEETFGANVNRLLKSGYCEAAASDEEIEIVKTYQCYICSESFESLDDLDKHSCAGPF